MFVWGAFVREAAAFVSKKAWCGHGLRVKCILLTTARSREALLFLAFVLITCGSVDCSCTEAKCLHWNDAIWLFFGHQKSRHKPYFTSAKISLYFLFLHKGHLRWLKYIMLYEGYNYASPPSPPLWNAYFVELRDLRKAPWGVHLRSVHKFTWLAVEAKRKSKKKAKSVIVNKLDLTLFPCIFPTQMVPPYFTLLISFPSVTL